VAFEALVGQNQFFKKITNSIKTSITLIKELKTYGF